MTKEQAQELAEKIRGMVEYVPELGYYTVVTNLEVKLLDIEVDATIHEIKVDDGTFD